MDEPTAPKLFVSMIKVDGMPIPVPPLILAEDRKNIEEWRKQAIAVEERLSLRRQQLYSSSQLKSRSQSSKIGAIPARSANFEERPQSRSISGEQVVRRALTSAAYNDEKAQMQLAGMLQKVALDDHDKDGQESSSQGSVDENGQMAHESAASGSINSGVAVPSASSTDLEPYLSPSSTSSSGETAGTVRPETLSADAGDNQEEKQQPQQLGPVSGVARGSYTIENPSEALLQCNQDGTSNESAMPHFGHLGSMVARYLTEQQRAKNLSEFAKLQSLLQENSSSASGPTKEPSNDIGSSVENSPTKKVQSEGATGTSPSVAGVKRRRGGESTSDRLVAMARGHLIRRVMQTQKVQHWIQTIRDCRRLLVPERSPGGLDWRSLADTRFREQVTSQLATALEEFHNIMFEWPLEDRLALIVKEDAQKYNTPRSASGRPLSKPRVSPAVISAASRTRSLSASTLQTQIHALQKQTSGAVASLRNVNGNDATKRRRLGANTPPKPTSAHGLSNQPSRVSSRPGANRPATSSGVSTGSHSPGSDAVSHGVASPRNIRHSSVQTSSRPSTAGGRLPDARLDNKRVEAAPAQPAGSSRRSTISGPHGNQNR